MSDYKKQALKALETAEQKGREALSIAFDDSKSAEDRLEAFSRIGSISDEHLVSQALEIVDNPEANERLRAIALEKISHRIGQDSKLLDKTTLMLTEKSLPDVVRATALRVLQANSFSSPTFLANRPTYMGALRALVDDANKDLREAAIEYLAMNKDEYVQRRLVEGLENPKKKLTKPQLAVQYLSYDLHADHFPILRRLVADPPNKKTRMEALRNLAADSGSIALMKKTMADKEEEPEIRHMSAVALQQLEPESFDEQADLILEAETEDAELKVALINTKIHSPGADVDKLASDLGQVIETTKRRKTKAQAKKLSALVAKERK